MSTNQSFTMSFQTYFKNLEAAIERVEKRLLVVEGRCAQFQAYIRRNTKSTTVKSTSPLSPVATTRRSPQCKEGAVSIALNEDSHTGNSSKPFEEDLDDSDEDDDSDVEVIMKSNSSSKKYSEGEASKAILEPSILLDKPVLEELTSTLLNQDQSSTGSNQELQQVKDKPKSGRRGKKQEKDLPEMQSVEATATEDGKGVIVADLGNIEKGSDVIVNAKTRSSKKRNSKVAQEAGKSSISVLDILENEDDQLHDSSVSSDEIEGANSRLAKRRSTSRKVNHSTTERTRASPRVSQTSAAHNSESLRPRRQSGVVKYLETSSEEEEFDSSDETSTSKTAKTDDGSQGSKPIVDEEMLTCRRPNIVEKKILSITRDPCYMCKFFHHKSNPTNCNLMCTGCTNRFGFQFTVCGANECWENHLSQICHEQVNPKSKRADLQDVINHHYYSRFNIKRFDFEDLKTKSLDIAKPENEDSKDDTEVTKSESSPEIVPETTAAKRGSKRVAEKATMNEANKEPSETKDDVTPTKPRGRRAKKTEAVVMESPTLDANPKLIANLTASNTPPPTPNENLPLEVPVPTRKRQRK